MALSSKEIEDVVAKIAGEDVVPLVKALKNKKNISEFQLADKIKKEINLTRNMLYRLYDSNLVSFIRKKDKKKGWYIYYWTFNTRRVKYLAEKLKKQRLEKLQERLAREKSSNFFICSNECIRLNFEQATDFEFKCPECGELLHQVDNTKKIEELEKEINKLEKFLRAKKLEREAEAEEEPEELPEKTKTKKAKKFVKKTKKKAKKKAKKKKAKTRKKIKKKK